ncbi:hypothetical protein EVAR_59744_1 [Eumeta japonica]|uniref:Uncharacterized protein n=1 Tax=Eumeta variegata TaxID=151549 RepID=A0A4C1Z4L5_EUMVA|nr:hypothetical protein EVAR_59744_1 [Eumeta japonica]
MGLTREGKGRAGHRNSHSLDEIRQRKLYQLERSVRRKKNMGCRLNSTDTGNGSIYRYARRGEHVPAT